MLKAAVQLGCVPYVSIANAAFSALNASDTFASRSFSCDMQETHEQQRNRGHMADT